MHQDGLQPVVMARCAPACTFEGCPGALIESAPCAWWYWTDSVCPLFLDEALLGLCNCCDGLQSVSCYPLTGSFIIYVWTQMWGI